MQTLSSKPVIETLRSDLKNRVAELLAQGVEPHVADVMVGTDEQSLKYIDKKSQKAKEYGIIFSTYHLEEDATYEQIQETLLFLARDPEINGIIVQLPLPERFTNAQVDALLALIPSAKDVDGLRGDWASLPYSTYTTENFLAQRPYALPPMVLAVTSLLNFYQISLTGATIVIVGKGRLVGQPLKEFYKKCALNVQTVDETTDSIFAITTQADILIAGTGEAQIITYQWIKEGAVVIDCSNEVHLDSVSQVASALSPSIGGVGPLTVFWLMHNTYQAAKNQS